jgi:hypothetical protein
MFGFYSLHCLIFAQHWHSNGSETGRNYEIIANKTPLITAFINLLIMSRSEIKSWLADTSMRGKVENE